jgi:hypothetical protein
MAAKKKFGLLDQFHRISSEFNWGFPADKKMLVARENIFIFPLRNSEDYFRLQTLRPDDYSKKISFYISLIKNVN